MIQRLLLSMFLFMLSSTHGYASPPIPESKSERLQKIQKELKDKKQDVQKIEKELDESKNDIKSTQSRSIKLANDIQKREKQILALEQKIEANLATKNALEADLEARKLDNAHLLDYYQKIKRRPPEADILKPGNAADNARSGKIISSILPDIQARVLKLKEDVTRLENITEQLDQDRAKRTDIVKKLARQQMALKNVVIQKNVMRTSLSRNYHDTNKQAQNLAKEAKTLSSLIQRLEAERKRKATPNKKPSPLKIKDGRLPVIGIIETAYGARDHLGSKSEGWHIRSQPGGIVTAPFSGTVRYAGPFSHFERIVLIEHKDHSYSLMAGLANINVDVNQELKQGEPVGNMAIPSGQGARPVLYYELHKNGKAIDPAPSFQS